ncbi:CMRF35-like molecule 7 [Protopterus annectens]|uniref:CMRF35-like molecule 7 n=1 Tax=Protopterus annectens TaxID=7888 RepID=UPI001CFABAF9|nr:CMRF35-like molecule 7 [Protopterus annectens]
MKTLLNKTWKLCVLQILFISASSAVHGPSDLIASLGESITIACQYDDKNARAANKYWCKGDNRFTCYVVVQTNGSETIVQKDRTSIMDNQTIQVFYVTVVDLSGDDNGSYWCGIDILGLDAVHQVKLTVIKASTVTAPTSRQFPNIAEITITSIINGQNAAERHQTNNVLVLTILAVLLVMVLFVAVIFITKLHTKKTIRNNRTPKEIQPTVLTLHSDTCYSGIRNDAVLENLSPTYVNAETFRKDEQIHSGIKTYPGQQESVHEDVEYASLSFTKDK